MLQILLVPGAGIVKSLQSVACNSWRQIYATEKYSERKMMGVSFDEKIGAYRISYDEMINGIRKRKTKAMPAGSTEECANNMEKMMRDPDFLFRESLRNSISEKDHKIGSIYAVKNIYLPGMVKIGMTRNSVFERVRNLSTAYPVDFEIILSRSVFHVDSIERSLHCHLRKYRVAMNREFFKISDVDAIKYINICHDIDGVNLADEISGKGRA